MMWLIMTRTTVSIGDHDAGFGRTPRDDVVERPATMWKNALPVSPAPLPQQTLKDTYLITPLGPCFDDISTRIEDIPTHLLTRIERTRTGP